MDCSMYWDNIQIEDLTQFQQNIVKAIGMEAFKNICLNMGGEQLTVPRLNAICKNARDRAIREDRARGDMTLNEIARKYSLSVRHINMIVSEARKG